MSERSPGFEPSGFFVLRSPLLAYDELLTWSDVHEGDSTAEIESNIRGKLVDLVTRPEIREAIFLASPRLESRIDDWVANPTDKSTRKVGHAVVRYFTRMAARPTPFGLFAGCSVGSLGSASDLHLGPTFHRHTRLDMEYLSALVAELEKDPDIRNSLRYRPNSSLYQAAGRLRYAEARSSEGVRSHHLVALDETEYLVATLERARQGARPSALAEALVDDDVSIEDALAYIYELIDNQVLVSDLAPPVTGEEPIHALVRELERHSAGAKAARTLDEARSALKRVDDDGLGIPSERYLEVAGLLERLPAAVELSRLFQVDVTRPTESLSLGPKVTHEVENAVRLLHRVSGRTYAENSLSRFRRAFTDRFGEREIPLLTALDEELGVGFEPSSAPGADASPLLAGLAFPSRGDESTIWHRREQILLGKVLEASAAGRDEIELTDEDIDEMTEEAPPLPDAFAVGVTVASSSEEDLDAGDFSILVTGVHGPSGARLLGRFCHADKRLRDCVVEHLRAEQLLEPDAIYAEIVHLPEGRLGNILLRPTLRDHEIAYLGRSGAPEEKQISVSDLRVSVMGDRILLRSQSLDREIVPRLTSAHNYTWRSLGVYRFLCALQTQGSSGGLQWSWGPLDSGPFLPRVRRGKTILARTSWLVTERELRELDRAGSRGIEEWRARRRIPRFASLVELDNELVIDWENPLSVANFLSMARRRTLVRLMEVWPTPDELCVTGSGGRFRHEMVIPFVASRSPSQRRSHAIASPEERRLFPPGSEWLYFKLYTGTATADVVLRDWLLPAARAYLERGAADSWFFLRFNDPEWHLRVRFHGEPEHLARDLRPAIEQGAAEVIRKGLAWRLQFDTYEREVERYGGLKGVELAEKIFHLDSEAAATIVTLLPGDEGMEARWRLTLRGIDLLMDDFGFSLEEKHAVTRRLRDTFSREFDADPQLQKKIGQRFRQERRSLEGLFGEPQGPLAAALDILRERSRGIRPLAQELRRLAETGELLHPLADLVPSFIHMHANRVLRSEARAQEMVIYDLLDRLYLGQKSRAKS